jgi:serine phosphatase RsbU (regulator of sigma subunit)
VNERAEYFGLQRLLQVVQEKIQLPAAELVSKVMRATQDFSDNIGFLDDITLVIVRRESV